MGKTKEELAEIDSALGDLAGNTDIASAGSKAAAKVGSLDEVDEQLSELGEGADVDVTAAQPLAGRTSASDREDLPTETDGGNGDGDTDAAAASDDTDAVGDDDFELLVDEDILELVDDD